MIMAYTLYAPQNITVRTADLDDIPMLLALPKLARFVPQAVLTNPNVIVNRSDITQLDSPTFTTLRFEFDSNEVSDMDQLEQNLTTWAQRCRILGVRGQRLAVVSESIDDSQTIVFTVLIGTVVFYNDRRVTVGVSVTDDELLADISNLFAHVPVEPTVKRIEADGSIVQVLPMPTPTPVAVFTIDPSRNMPVVSLDHVALSLIRLGTDAATLLVSRATFDNLELRTRIDELQLQLSSIRAQLD